MRCFFKYAHCSIHEWNALLNVKLTQWCIVRRVRTNFRRVEASSMRQAFHASRLRRARVRRVNLMIARTQRIVNVRHQLNAYLLRILTRTLMARTSRFSPFWFALAKTFHARTALCNKLRCKRFCKSDTERLRCHAKVRFECEISPQATKHDSTCTCFV